MQKKLLSRSNFWRNCALLNKSAPENAKWTSHFGKNIHHSSSSAKLFFLRKIRVWEQPQKLNQSQIANLTTSRFVWGILCTFSPFFAKLLLLEQIRVWDHPRDIRPCWVTAQIFFYVLLRKFSTAGVISRDFMLISMISCPHILLPKRCVWIF